LKSILYLLNWKNSNCFHSFAVAYQMRSCEPPLICADAYNNDEEPLLAEELMPELFGNTNSKPTKPPKPTRLPGKIIHNPNWNKPR